MSENAKERLNTIKDIVEKLPKEIQDQYAARMEGFAEGFAAGKAHANATAAGENQK